MPFDVAGVGLIALTSMGRRRRSIIGWLRRPSGRPLVRARHLGKHLQRAGRSRRCSGPVVHRQQLHQGPPLRRRRKRGALAHGIGRTKGGRNTKLHAICDAKGRPCVLLLTPGNVHDGRVAQLCIEAMPPSAELVADKGYDSQALREWLVERGTQPIIPPRKNRKVQYCGPACKRDPVSGVIGV